MPILYKDYQPTSWDSKANFMGNTVEIDNFYVAPGILPRDSKVYQESNFQAILDLLGGELLKNFSDDLGNDDLPCPHCEHVLSDGDQWAEEADHWIIEAEGYELELTNDNLELIVIKSPVMICAQFCSPCFPGAGNLDNPCPNGPLTYALELDWFDDYNPAPYTEQDLIKV